jgi:hypothetical protein
LCHCYLRLGHRSRSPISVHPTGLEAQQILLLPSRPRISSPLDLFCPSTPPPTSGTLDPLGESRLTKVVSRCHCCLRRQCSGSHWRLPTSSPSAPLSPHVALSRCHLGLVGLDLTPEPSLSVAFAPISSPNPTSISVARDFVCLAFGFQLFAWIFGLL